LKTTALDNEVNLWGTSKYYDLAEICETFKKYGTDGFTVVHVNVRRLSKNLFKLEDFVTVLPTGMFYAKFLKFGIFRRWLA